MDLLVTALHTLGALLMLLAALGIVRMPDLYTRIQAATKATSLGAGVLVVGTALSFGSLGISVRSLAMVLFIFLTVPTAAHMLARAAYVLGVPLWEGTIIDELEGRYRPDEGVLESGPPEGEAAPDLPTPGPVDPPRE